MECKYCYIIKIYARKGTSIQKKTIPSAAFKLMVLGVTMLRPGTKALATAARTTTKTIKRNIF